MSNPQTTEERVAVVEALNKDVMKRVERLENKLIGALGIGAIAVVGIVIQIILTVFKR